MQGGSCTLRVGPSHAGTQRRLLLLQALQVAQRLPAAHAKNTLPLNKAPVSYVPADRLQMAASWTAELSCAARHTYIIHKLLQP